MKCGIDFESTIPRKLWSSEFILLILLPQWNMFSMPVDMHMLRENYYKVSNIVVVIVKHHSFLMLNNTQKHQERNNDIIKWP